MDESDKDQIFDPFFHDERGREGDRLGLSIVYGIVSQNKGQVDVESQPGSRDDIHHIPAPDRACLFVANPRGEGGACGAATRSYWLPRTTRT